MRLAPTVALLLALQSTGCMTYVAYKKLDTGRAPLATGALLGIGQAFLGASLALWASERAGAPELSTSTWLIAGEATVFGLDALAAIGLVLLDE